MKLEGKFPDFCYDLDGAKVKMHMMGFFVSFRLTFRQKRKLTRNILGTTVSNASDKINKFEELVVYFVTVVNRYKKEEEAGFGATMA